MTIIKFWGGLGNQMFQYALYKSIEIKQPKVKADIYWYESHIAHNGFELEHVFDIRLNKVGRFTANLFNGSNRKWFFRKLRRILGLKNAYIEERHFYRYDPELFKTKGTKLFSGYWQNPGYFSNIENDLRISFYFKQPLTEKNQLIFDNMCKLNSVSIHVRRGDYVNDPLLGGLCSTSYYQDAINYIKDKVPSAEFYIFSDDVDWCLHNLVLSNATYISWNTGRDSYVDMQLMSNCKHNIIANSSFSWWAAWLNNNPEKIVISPKHWANDQKLDTATLSLSEWVTI